ncbi:unnamed protein product, partial [Protopolystoma xenopodis]
MSSILSSHGFLHQPTWSCAAKHLDDWPVGEMDSCLRFSLWPGEPPVSLSLNPPTPTTTTTTTTTTITNNNNNNNNNNTGIGSDSFTFDSGVADCLSTAVQGEVAFTSATPLANPAVGAGFGAQAVDEVGPLTGRPDCLAWRPGPHEASSPVAGSGLTQLAEAAPPAGLFCCPGNMAGDVGGSSSSSSGFTSFSPPSGLSPQSPPNVFELPAPLFPSPALHEGLGSRRLQPQVPVSSQSLLPPGQYVRPFCFFSSFSSLFSLPFTYLPCFSNLSLCYRLSFTLFFDSHISPFNSICSLLFFHLCSILSHSPIPLLLSSFISHCSLLSHSPIPLLFFYLSHCSLLSHSPIHLLLSSLLSSLFSSLSLSNSSSLLLFLIFLFSLTFQFLFSSFIFHFSLLSHSPIPLFLSSFISHCSLLSHSPIPLFFSFISHFSLLSHSPIPLFFFLSLIFLFSPTLQLLF